MSQPKSNEERATEIWALIHSGLVKDGVKFPKNFDGIGAAYGGYARLIEALAQKDAEVADLITRSRNIASPLSEDEFDRGYATACDDILNELTHPTKQTELLNTIKKKWDKQAENLMNGLDKE